MAKGWTPRIIETIDKEDGGVTVTEIDNPVSALDFAIESIQKYVSIDFANIYQQHLIDQANKKAELDLVNMGIK